MWVWEVDDEVKPIAFYYQTLGSYLYAAYIAMLCSYTWIGFECIP